MALSLAESLSVLTQSGKAMLEAVQASGAGSDQRPARIAEALRSLGKYPLYGCMLRGDSGAAVLDATGRARSDWSEVLHEQLEHVVGNGAKGPSVTEAPPELSAAGRLVLTPVIFRDQRFGTLALQAAADDVEVVAALLEHLSCHLGCALYLEDQLATAGDPDRRRWLGFVSETTALVAHEFNNYLNGIMLHLALLKQESAGKFTGELDVMKRLASDAAGLIRKLQQYNGRGRLALEPTDLNQTLRTLFADGQRPAGATELRLELAADLPRIQANARDLTRLLELLVQQSAAAMSENPGPIVLRTEYRNRRVVLTLEDVGPPLSGEALQRLFEPFYIARPGTEEPGLALGHTLARRLQASLRAENRPERGVVFIVEFAPAVPAA